MLVRCLHCQEPIEVPDEGDLSKVRCPICGGSFSLVGESTAPYTGAETRTLGHFELIEEVGAGAFGSVWKACDRKLDRVVAVKVPRKGKLEADEAELFLREARAAAQLRHPNIVAVHEVGREGDTVYIVSDFIQGATLDQWLTGRRLSPREAAELCLQIAEALDYAHQSGVVHRDLKPGNIMLDLSHRPHLLDFGLARRVGREATMTIGGRVLGTPAYMSPEQARGEAHTADHRTDIYSLGVILFRLLTGELPFRGNAQMLILQILQDEPPSPRKLNSHVPRDLETICLKCLEKDPENRYVTAQALAEDLRQFLAGEPIAARPITRVERGWRWCKRKPVVAGLSAAVLGLLLTIAIAAPLVAWREAVLRGDATRAAEKAQEESANRRGLLYISDMARATQAWGTGDLKRLEALLRRHVPRGEEEDLRGWEWYYLWRLWKRESAADWIQLPGATKYTTLNLAVSADGSRVAVAHPRGPGSPAASILDFVKGTQEPFEPMKAGPGGWLSAIALSRDGKFLAFPGDDPTAVVVTSLDTGERRAIKAGARVHALCFSPSGQTLAIACADSSTQLWDLNRPTAKPIPADHRGAVQSLAFSPDGAVLVSADQEGTICAWSLAENKLLWKEEGHSNWVNALAYAPDGAYLVSGSADRTVAVWEKTGRRLRTLPGARDEVRALAFSQNGRLLAAGCRDGQIRLWVLPGFAEYGVISGYNSLYGLGFLPNGRLVFGGLEGRLVVRTVREDGFVDVLSVPRSGDFRSPGNSVGERRYPVFSPDSSILAATDRPEHRRILLWRLTEDRADPLEPLAVEYGAGTLAMSPSGVLAVCDSASATVGLFDLKSRRPIGELKDPRKASAMSATFSATGRRLAVGYDNGTLIVWDVEGRRAILDCKAHQGTVGCLCFCGDETSVLTGGGDYFAKVWDVDRAQMRHDFGQQLDSVTAVAASSDGNLLATGYFAGSPRIDLWRGDSYSRLGVLQGHTATIWGLAVFSDGNTLASSSGDRTLRLWDLRKSEERFLIEEKVRVNSLTPSPDGRTLAACIGDGTIRLYRAATPAQVQAEPDWWRLPEGQSEP